MPERLTLREIEKDFPLSKRVIYKWIKKGKLNTKKEKGEVFVMLQDIKKLLDEI